MDLSSKIFNLSCYFINDDEHPHTFSNQLSTKLFDIKEQLDLGKNHIAFIMFNQIFSFIDRNKSIAIISNNEEKIKQIENAYNVIKSYEKYFKVDSKNN